MIAHCTTMSMGSLCCDSIVWRSRIEHTIVVRRCSDRESGWIWNSCWTFIWNLQILVRIGFIRSKILLHYYWLLCYLTIAVLWRWWRELIANADIFSCSFLIRLAVVAGEEGAMIFATSMVHFLQVHRTIWIRLIAPITLVECRILLKQKVALTAHIRRDSHYVGWA